MGVVGGIVLVSDDPHSCAVLGIWRGDAQTTKNECLQNVKRRVQRGRFAVVSKFNAAKESQQGLKSLGKGEQGLSDKISAVFSLQAHASACDPIERVGRSRVLVRRDAEWWLNLGQYQCLNQLSAIPLHGTTPTLPTDSTQCFDGFLCQRRQ